MRRRDFVMLVSGAAMAWPLAGLAQQASGPRKVGVLFPGVLGADRERLITEGLTIELGSEKFVLIVRSAEGMMRYLGNTRTNWLQAWISFLHSRREVL